MSAKVIKFAIWSILFFVWIFYILPVILFRIPYFQKEIAIIASKYLERRIGTDANIDRIEFRFFDKLILKNVCLKDEYGDTLFTAKKIVVGFDFLPLFKHRIRINYARMFVFTFNLTRESANSPLNIQYVIDAFAKREKKQGNIELSMRNVSLKGGNFSYRVKDRESTPYKFNFNDICLREITGTIQSYKFGNMISKADIEQLSFVEKSGFQAKRLAFDLIIDSNNIRINQFDLNLPASHLLLKKIVTAYSHSKKFFTNKTRFSFQLEPSQISLKDICPFIPIFSYSKNQLAITGKFAGDLDDLKLTGVTIRESDNTINADAEICHLKNPFQTSVYANVKNACITPLVIQKIANIFSLQAVNMPLVKKIGKISFNGKISGNFNNLNTNININSEAGNLHADVRFGKKRTINFLSGKISTFGFKMRKLTDNNNFDLDRLTLNLNSVFNNRWKDWRGNVVASIKGFNYKSSYFKRVYLSGYFTSNSFKGSLKANSLDGQIDTDGFILLKGKDSKFDFLANISDMAFDKLCSTTKYKDLKLSFIVGANLTGNCIDNFIGNITFQRLKCSTDKDIYSMDSIRIDAIAIDENEKRILLRSDIVNGEIDGTSPVKNLIGALQHCLLSYLPSLAIFKRFLYEKERNDFQLDLTVNNSQKPFSFFKFPIVACEQLHISGQYNSLQNQFCLNACCPHLDIGNCTIKDGFFYLGNKKDHAELNLSGDMSVWRSDNELIVCADLKARKDSICSVVGWKNNGGKQYSGELNFVTDLKLQKTNPIVSVQLHPSKLIIGDSVWVLTPANIVYDRSADQISINHFLAKSNEKSIVIDGIVSENENDVLGVFLTKVDIGRIFKLLSIKAIDFGGVATGYIKVKDVFHTLQLSTVLNIHGFTFNDIIMGDLALRGEWNENERNTKINGKIVNENKNFINIDGFVCPVKKRISILLDMRNMKIAFLNKCLDNVLFDFYGELIGNLHLFGDLNDLAIEGDVLVNDGRLSIKNFNTNYTFNSWIKCTRNEIRILNIEIYDKYINKAIGDIFAKYNAFRDFQLTGSLSYKNLLILDTYIDSLFYGKIFVTGSTTFNGDKESIFIKTSLRNDENTTLTFNCSKIFDFTDSSLENNRNKKFGIKPKDDLINFSKFRTSFDMTTDINVNNDASLELISVYSLDNKMSLVGNGDLRIRYTSKTPLEIFGKYTIERGELNFSLLYPVVNRFFEITNGSSICFSGDPLMANLDVKASYFIPDFIKNENNRYLDIRRNIIPVDIILLFSGQLKSPDIKYVFEERKETGIESEKE